MRALLGWPSESTFYQYKTGKCGTLAYDTLTRLSLIIGIYKALHILYPDETLADNWVRLPNRNPPLRRPSRHRTHGQRRPRRPLPSPPPARRTPRRVTIDLPPVAEIDWPDTCRLISSRYPPVGILDRVASPDDLEAVFVLEGLTNDRIRVERGQIYRLPKTNGSSASRWRACIMAAFCHPRPGGGRFNSEYRGAWYAGRALETAQREVIYHRGRELAEIGMAEARLEMRLYLADFAGSFRNVRDGWDAVHDPVHYTTSQHLAEHLLEAGSTGVVYRSVRHEGGECIACFRPKPSPTSAPPSISPSSGRGRRNRSSSLWAITVPPSTCNWLAGKLSWTRKVLYMFSLNSRWFPLILSGSILLNACLLFWLL